MLDSRACGRLDSLSRQYEDVDVAKNQAPHHAPDAPVAQAIALREQGYSFYHIADIVGHPEPTVRRWYHESEVALGNKAVLNKWTRRTLQAQDILEIALDLIQDDTTGNLALKNLYQVNAIAGTGTDKLQRESNPTPTQQNVLIIVRPDRPIQDEGELA